MIRLAITAHLGEQDFVKLDRRLVGGALPPRALPRAGLPKLDRMRWDTGWIWDVGTGKATAAGERQNERGDARLETREG